jgi:hypothetical protein
MRCPYARYPRIATRQGYLLYSRSMSKCPRLEGLQACVLGRIASSVGVRAGHPAHVALP